MKPSRLPTTRLTDLALPSLDHRIAPRALQSNSLLGWWESTADVVVLQGVHGSVHDSLVMDFTAGNMDIVSSPKCGQ